MTSLPETFAQSVERVGINLARVRSAIERAGADPGAVQIVAVTKGQPGQIVRAALANDLSDFGENYADELLGKAEALSAGAEQDTDAHHVRWHFQGRMQTNKINRLVPHVWLWQSIDSASHARALAARSPGSRVLVQVDETGSPGRGGVAPADASELVGQARDLGLEVSGLMCVAGRADGAGRTPAATFAAVADLAGRLGLPVRSMGMSDDFEEAVRAGSTMVRIGSALFGPRTG